jgi:hypothetical protein
MWSGPEVKIPVWSELTRCGKAARVWAEMALDVQLIPGDQDVRLAEFVA